MVALVGEGDVIHTNGSNCQTSKDCCGLELKFRKIVFEGGGGGVAASS